jgi:hypothetical protein
MTECIQESFSFTAHFSRGVQAEFTAGRISSDGGALLLREADCRVNLLGRAAGCFIDGRAPLLVKHRLSEMLAQRIYGPALGYEDTQSRIPICFPRAITFCGMTKANKLDIR